FITTFTSPYLIKWALSFRSTKPAVKPRLWDGHLGEFEIHPHSAHAGQTLEEIKLRENHGVTIVAILRGDRKLIAPGKAERVMPYDRLIILGTDAQLTELESYFRTERLPESENTDEYYDLTRVASHAKEEWIGKTLRESGIREKLDGLILGIERGVE